MSTRSQIAIANTDGTVTSIYCHSDGYPRFNGRILRDHYKTESKVRKLIALGDLSTLGKNLGTKHSFDWRSELYVRYRDKNVVMHEDPEYKRFADMCTAFGRDRGESGVDATDHSDLTAAMSYFTGSDREWYYLFTEATGQWQVTGGTVWVPLDDLNWGDTPFEEDQYDCGYHDEHAKIELLRQSCRVRTRRIDLMPA